MAAERLRRDAAPAWLLPPPGRRRWMPRRAPPRARTPRRPPLLLGTACCLLFGPRSARADGLLAEIFAPLAATCGVNGSVGVLDGLLPSITRRDVTVNYPERRNFGIKRCAWEVIGGNTVFNCRGSDEAQKYFAARWTGSLVIRGSGTYTFQIEADDGARLTMGYGRCPGVTCGDKQATLNAQYSELKRTGLSPNAYAKNCEQCAQGLYANCWNTQEGCEPFSVWRLEADGGVNGPCGSPGAIVNGTRYLSGGAHPIELVYFQRGGGARMVLKYSGPDTSNLMMPVPESALIFPRSNALRAEWFVLPQQPSRLPAASPRGDPPPGAQLLSREDDGFDSNGPGVGGFSDRVKNLNRPIMVRWIGLFNIVSGGEYIFRLESDDGSRVIIAARGPGGERVLISNDGVTEGARSSSRTVVMLPGLHPIRVEYFWVPGVDLGYGSVPRPPGVQLFFSGPDTRSKERLVTKDRFLIADGTCQLNNFDWSRGMYMSRDCKGDCIDTQEGVVGDKVCDNGRRTSLGVRKLLTCAAYNFDNYDCEPPDPPPPLVNRPRYQCHVSCPSGNFRRRDCTLCPGKHVQSQNGPFCSESFVGNLSFIRCCAAKLRGVEYWGQDCVAFGTTTRCNETLVDVLDALRSTEPSLDWKAARKDGSQPFPTGELTQDCEGDYCNKITTAFVLDRWSLLPTDQPVCPIQESKQNGTECFVGPWEATYLKDPFTECQQGRYKWNFCRNRKTVDGRPFARCCSFVYLNAQGAGECRFVGVAEGTCERYIVKYREKYRGTFFSISNPNVLNDCAGDLCNDPTDPDKGCPSKVDYDHPFTLGDRLKGPVDWSRVKADVEQHPGEINWVAIFIPVAGVLFLGSAALVYRRSLKVTEESPWHSSRAKVLGKDTFVEPERDPHDPNAPGYHVVKPRPPALKAIIHQDKVKPKALFLDPDVACQEAAISAEADREAREAAITGVPVSLQIAAEAEAGAPPPPQQLPSVLQGVALEELELPGMRDPSKQVGPAALPGEVVHQLALQNDAAAAQAAPETTALVLRAAPGDLQERLDQVYVAPEALLPVATMAVTQTALMAPGATPGATPAIGPLGATRGRPAAAARMMRQGVGGPPRVAM
uniref:PA14 domain-containing protein n=1 Tax=Alexandrium monilatum TaxID=311494 RepID=A0A7S4RBE6_9DINO